MDNLYIKLHKGARQPFYKQKAVSQYPDFFKGKTLNDNSIEDFGRGYNKFDYELIKSLWFRQLIHAKSLCRHFPQRALATADFRAIDAIAKDKAALFEEQGLTDYQVNWRLAIGLGNASVFENSLTLHHVYGIPYIPASSVKGIIRSWLIQEYFSYGKDENESGEGIALKDSEDFCLIFGTPSEFKIKENSPSIKSRLKNEEGKPTAHVGNVVFFDAYPISKPKVYVDIMNPHYPDYYREGTDKPPADWQNPVPIFFLTIKDTAFQFLFGIRKGCLDAEYGRLSSVSFEHPSNPEMSKNGPAEKVLKELLEEALFYIGLGAKTATGYGRMKNASKIQLARIKEQKEQEVTLEAQRKAIEEENRRKADEEKRQLEELARKQEENARKKELQKKSYEEEGLVASLSEAVSFEDGKKIISDFKRVVGDIPESEFQAIFSFVEGCYMAATSNREKKKWTRKGKGNWGAVRSWTSAEIANLWFDDIISK